MSRGVDRIWHLRWLIWHRDPDFISCELAAET